MRNKSPDRTHWNLFWRSSIFCCQLRLKKWTHCQHPLVTTSDIILKIIASCKWLSMMSQELSIKWHQLHLVLLMLEHSQLLYQRLFLRRRTAGVAALRQQRVANFILLNDNCKVGGMEASNISWRTSRFLSAVSLCYGICGILVSFHLGMHHLESWLS